MATVTGGGVTHPAVLIETALGRAAQTVAHPIIGRAAPMVTVTGPPSTRTGTLVFHCASMAAADALVGVLDDAAPCVLITPEHPSLSGMRFVVSEFRVDPWERLAAGWACRVTCTVVEVD